MSPAISFFSHFPTIISLSKVSLLAILFKTSVEITSSSQAVLKPSINNLMCLTIYNSNTLLLKIYFYKEPPYSFKFKSTSLPKIKSSAILFNDLYNPEYSSPSSIVLRSNST